MKPKVIDFQEKRTLKISYVFLIIPDFETWHHSNDIKEGQ